MVQPNIYKKYGSKAIRKRKPLSQEVRKAVFTLLFGLVLITVVLSIVFLLNTSSSAQKGYIYSQLRLQNEELEALNRELKMKVIEAKSLFNPEKAEKSEDMVKPDSMMFME